MRKDILTFCEVTGIRFHGTPHECPNCYPENAKKYGVKPIEEEKGMGDQEQGVPAPEVLPAEEKGALVKMAMTLPQEAQTYRVEDEEGKVKANEFYLQCREARQKIDKFYDPKIKKAQEVKKVADEARAALVREKEEVTTPIKQAEEIIGKIIQGYVDAQAEIAKARREEDERIEKKRREDDALAAAVQATEMGLPEMAERILDEPAAAAQVYVPTAKYQAPKTEGLAFVEHWDFELMDLKALAKAALEGKIPMTAIQANEVLIGQQVRSLQKEFNWPGIRVFMEKKPKGTTFKRRGA